MSHPLKRRMAQAALLVAAAAPVIGLGAGTASAAGLPDLGGLSSTDAASALGSGLDGATHSAMGVASDAGHNAQATLVPAAHRTVESAGETLVPAAQKTVGDAAGQVGQATGHAAQGATRPAQGEQNGPMLPVGGLPAL